MPSTVHVGAEESTHRTWLGSRMWCYLTVIVLLQITASLPCDINDEICEFWFVVEHKLTMMQQKVAVYPSNGKLYRYDVTNTSHASPIPVQEVISADGWEESRLVVVVNGSLPGPPIIVYENQTVIVHVRNALKSDAVTIHWHGLHQPETPWMDGSAFITQCPIDPGQSFTYRFKAKPKGTFWYHSHIGAQRSMGLFGAFVIREKKSIEMEEFILSIQDWNHDWESDLSHHKMVYGAYENRKKFSKVKNPRGLSILFKFQSGLINGRGRFYYPDGSHNGAPLEKFVVEQNRKCRFRVIGTGSMYPFRISIDSHVITIVASDGYDIKPVVAESFIINPGERFDFIITANQTVGNYWIRGGTLKAGVNFNYTAEAILQYKGAKNDDPSTSRRACTASERCLIVNCPLSFYPEVEFTDCFSFNEIKALGNNDPAPPKSPGNFKEHFLNFAFPGTSWTPGSINGKAFKAPTVSALTQAREIETTCNTQDCGEEKICACTHSLEATHGDTIQMVFLNMGNGKGWPHPIHMHGHSFYVMKIGFATYNESNGILIGDNLDIDCRGGTSRDKSFCNAATWTNLTWTNGNVPDLELQNPPRKDTIIVPEGGYVVIRIKADNPGLWFMHCHLELHNLDGMAMVINESFPEQPAAPKGFPICRSYPPPPWILDQSQQPPSTTDRPRPPPTAPSTPHALEGILQGDTFWIAAGVLIALNALQLIIMMFLCYSRHNSGDEYSVSEGKSNTGFDIGSK